MQSGIVPELLAGQVYQQSNDIVPTRTGNVWFARGFAFVEAGGAILSDPTSWARLVKGLQPGKIKALVGKGGQAPRGVLLCVSLEAFLNPGGSGALEAAARYLSARLGEIAQILGISFPVYVLFTKADRVPFFTDYVRMLTNDEAGQVLGATLPMRDVRSGVYAEEETRRLTEAFNQLFYSLCDNRVVYMPREDDPAVIPGAYEFPREFRKLRGAMVQFLVDICRPSQLRVSPFLRGFYFSGARPVVVSDVNVSRAPEQQRPQAEEFGGATSMFRVGMKEEMLARHVDRTVAAQRKEGPAVGLSYAPVSRSDHAGRRGYGCQRRQRQDQPLTPHSVRMRHRSVRAAGDAFHSLLLRQPRSRTGSSSGCAQHYRFG